MVNAIVVDVEDDGTIKINGLLVLLRNRGLSVRCCDSGVFHAHREITIISP